MRALAWCLVKIPYEFFGFLACFSRTFGLRHLFLIQNSFYSKKFEVLIFPFYAVLYRHT